MERPVLLYAGTVTSGNYGPSSEELGCARASHNCTFLSKSLHFSGPHFIIYETEKMILTMTVYELKVLTAQSCLTLCNPVDWSPPDSSVHGILQARILEWVAIPFFRRSSQPRHRTWVSCIAGYTLSPEPPGKWL